MKQKFSKNKINPKDSRLKTKPKFSIWKTVEIGNVPHGAREIKNELHSQRVIKFLTYRAYYLLDLIEYSTKVQKINLVKVSVNDLGITEWKKLAPGGRWISNVEIVETRARKLGLKLCPAEVAPSVFLGPYDSFEGGLIFGSEPIITTDLPNTKHEEQMRFITSTEREYVVDEWFDKGKFLGAAEYRELEEDAKLLEWVFAL